MLPALRDEHGAVGAIVAIGDNGVRRSFADRIDAMGVPLLSVVHPSARLAHNVAIGRNVVIAAGARPNAALFEKLDGVVPVRHLIGDSRAPNGILEAIREANDICSSL